MKTSLILVDNRGKEIRGYSRDGHREEKQVFSFKTESEAKILAWYLIFASSVKAKTSVEFFRTLSNNNL
jgi:hypothetical protein